MVVGEGRGYGGLFLLLILICYLLYWVKFILGNVMMIFVFG